MKKKPKASKKITVITGISLLIILTTWIILARNAAEKEVQRATITTDYSFNELVDIDTDFDGIPDWKELLIGTNPLEYDTDNDGLSDGDLSAAIDLIYSSREISELKEQYPEASDEELLSLIRSSNSESLELTTTEQVGRELYVAGTMMNSLGKLTPELESSINENFIEDNIYGYTYPLRNITSFEYYDEYFPEGDILYINSVIEAINVDYFVPEPINTMTNSLENENEDLARKGLATNVNKLTTVLSTLDSMNVPVEFTEEHVELTNSFVRLLTDVSEMQTFYDDPLQGYAAIMRYIPNVTNHAETIEVVTNQFQKALESISSGLSN